ncbi:hypothetical protein KUTeg_007952 [Tegillarca granosa]|uniref:Peptidase M24 C-terminal domain-containing protein n=1 Tax=Tegillarca granosa TaxID=220873 RepID=A0ABQ9FEQ6_TEGGR|nr:hypothetical protein KUTeg_007952 [Tegillarca granosa]
MYHSTNFINRICKYTNDFPCHIRLLMLMNIVMQSPEPGYYEDGKFGIRLENIFFIKKATGLKYAFPDTTFLEFETITLVPYEPHLIKFDMLSEAQIDWMNAYYQKIRQNILPLRPV